MEFENKTLLVTGAASGMGYLSAACFAREGANIVMVDFNEEALTKCVEEIKQITPNVIGCVADVRDYAQVIRARDAAVERFFSIDILICCAGGAETRLLNSHLPFYEQPIEVIDYGLDLNLKGAIYFDHAVMQQMVKQKSGVIINLGSITGEEGGDGSLAYSASKSALMNGVVKSLAISGAEHNIRACCIAPGPVLTRAAMAGMKTILGYAAEPQEIVDMFMFVASDKGRSITGTTFLMDGGRNVIPR